MIEHMNEDHSNVIVASLNAQHGIKDKKAKMIALCIDGYYVASKNKIFFIAFENACLNVKSYREMLVSQAKKYREFE